MIQYTRELKAKVEGKVDCKVAIIFRLSFSDLFNLRTENLSRKSLSLSVKNAWGVSEWALLEQGEPGNSPKVQGRADTISGCRWQHSVGARRLCAVSQLTWRLSDAWRCVIKCEVKQVVCSGRTWSVSTVNTLILTDVTVTRVPHSYQWG
jgi:hypothetical protein